MGRPKQIQIMGQVIDIIFDDNHCHLNDCIGIAESQKNRITLSSKQKDGTRIPDAVIHETLIHEIIHIILDKMGNLMYRDVTINEEFVIMLAGLLHQAYTSIK